MNIGDTVRNCPVCHDKYENGDRIFEGSPHQLLCEICANASISGIGGTDSNVEPLFKDRPSAAPLPAQPEVVEELEKFMLSAASGKITGLIAIGFNEDGKHLVSMVGKVQLNQGVSSLEQLKFFILARDYAAQLARG